MPIIVTLTIFNLLYLSQVSDENKKLQVSISDIKDLTSNQANNATRINTTKRTATNTEGAHTETLVTLKEAI